jgi:hypothetical protein
VDLCSGEEIGHVRIALVDGRIRWVESFPNVFEEAGHVIGIPARYLRRRHVDSALIEQGPRVACAIAAS